MNRRAYLVAVATSVGAIAGCTDNDNGSDEEPNDPGDGEVVFQDTVGGDSGMDIGGGSGGIGGENDGGMGDGGPGAEDDSGFVFTQRLEEGERLEVRITNRAYGTEYDIYAPDGEVIVQEATDGEKTTTVEADQSGEYDVLIKPDGGAAEVSIVVYPPADDSDA